MKRNPDLIREILFYIEQNYEAGEKWITSVEIEGYPDEVIAEHIVLAYQDGLIQAIKDVSSFSGMEYWPGNLTSSGYDFLDKIRNDSIWNKTKAVITEKGLPMLTSTISTIANALITSTAEGVANAILKKGGIM